jgi:hypothetical protein
MCVVIVQSVECNFGTVTAAFRLSGVREKSIARSGLSNHFPNCWERCSVKLNAVIGPSFSVCPCTADTGQSWALL